MMPAIFARILAEPLVWFSLVAGMLLGVESLLENEKPVLHLPGDWQAVVIEQQENLRGEPLDEKQVARVLDQHLQEELLLREAYRLGLHYDPVIRSRLLNKMKYLIAAEVDEPSEPELLAFYQAARNRYRAAASFDLEHVDFPGKTAIPDWLPATPGASVSADAAEQLEKMISGRLTRADSGELMARFGMLVMNHLVAAEPGRWYGPWPSPKGEHFIRITAIHRGQVKPFQQVRPYVYQHWKDEQADRLLAVKVDELKGAYRIVVGPSGGAP